MAWWRWSGTTCGKDAVREHGHCHWIAIRVADTGEAGKGPAMRTPPRCSFLAAAIGASRFGGLCGGGNIGASGFGDLLAGEPRLLSRWGGLIGE